MEKASPLTLKRLAALWHRRPILTTTFGVAAALTVIFALKATFFFAQWNSHRERIIEPWMSPQYIARVWKIDQAKINELAGIEDASQYSLPLARIARQRGENPRETIKKLEQLITEERREPSN